MHERATVGSACAWSADMCARSSWFR